MQLLLKEIATTKYWSLRRLFLTAAILLLSVLLFIPLREFYEKNIIDQCLSRLEAIMPWIRDIAFFLLLLLVVVIFIRLYVIKSSIINDNLLLLLIFVGFLYVIAQMSSRYAFFGFFQSKSIFLAYANLVLVASGGAVVLLYHNSQCEKVEIEKRHQAAAQKADKKIVKDLFDRMFFVERIVDKMKMAKAENEAYIISINGSWGSGKTWFMDEIKKRFDSANYHVMSFNPWKFDNAGVIVHSFFKEFAEQFSKIKDRQLIKDMHAYAKKLVEIDGNMLTRSISVVTGIFSEKTEEGTNDIYERINQHIKAQQKNIVVFIDDIDRLDKKEIIEVLKLLRNTANFSNTVYCVAHDKYYVQEAVKELNPYNYTSYLDKIFSFEFSLPLIEVGYLRKVIKKTLVDGLSEKERERIEASVDLICRYNSTYYTDVFLTHPRESERLAKSLLFDINAIATEVDFVDFYLLQLLKIKFPEVYNLLLDWKRFYERVEDDYFKVLTYNEPENGDKRSVIEKYLHDNKTLLGIPDYKTSYINHLIEHLTDHRLDVNVSAHFRSYRSFNYANNHSKYFSLRLDSTCITHEDFIEARRLPWLKFLNHLEQWFETGKINDVYHKLKYCLEFNNHSEFENNFRALKSYTFIYQTKHNGLVKMNIDKLLSQLARVHYGNQTLKTYELSGGFQEFICEMLSDPYFNINASETRDFISKIVNTRETRIFAGPILQGALLCIGRNHDIGWGTFQEINGFINFLSHPR